MLPDFLPVLFVARSGGHFYEMLIGQALDQIEVEP